MMTRSHRLAARYREQSSYEDVTFEYGRDTGGVRGLNRSDIEAGSRVGSGRTVGRG